MDSIDSFPSNLQDFSKEQLIEKYLSLSKNYSSHCSKTDTKIYNLQEELSEIKVENEELKKKIRAIEFENEHLKKSRKYLENLYYGYKSKCEELEKELEKDRLKPPLSQEEKKNNYFKCCIFIK
jgi:predicted nuclease with TOPRIM domain